MVRKIGICGHFDFKSEAAGGQIIKTRIISETLSEIYGSNQVINLDTANWKSNAPLFFVQCIILAIKCENIIILPASNGIKVFIPLFVLLTKLLNKKLHYVIVGAWLADSLKNNRYLITPTKKIDYIYCQTNTLINKLTEIGIKHNTYLMPNFKRINPIEINIDDMKYEKPLKLCILSRINYKKGVESAVNVIDKLNQKYKEKVIELHIYGPIEDEYKERFNQLLNKYCSFAKYKGIVDYNDTAKVLKDYYLLLFPTRYYTEGFPGTVLDAYLGGVPVLASRWESWSDIIEEGCTGFTYEFNNDDDFCNKLECLINNIDLVIKLKKNCLDVADKYSVENAIKVLTNNINI